MSSSFPQEKFNSTRLAKNAVFMYIRMIILTIITLFTSRVILKQLGIEDYGIYNLVGSIIMMFNSLRTVFASSTQRYLSYEMGRNDGNNLCKIFNVSIQLDFLIVIIFLLLVEVVGLWFITNKINVSPERIVAVHYILQFSIFGAIISIFTTSFDAVILAHEKMSFYAYLSIFEAILKLLICYLIAFASDKLIAYGFLVLVTVLIVFVINFLYCRVSFAEVRFRKVSDQNLLRNMASFAGWNFLGNSAFALSQNGLNMVLNIFGGPIVNAARGIAYQVNQVLLQVINNVVMVFKPYTIKKYAEGDYVKTKQITFFTSKLYFVIQLCIVTIISFYVNEIIQLWLGQIPLYVNQFLILLLWQSLVRSLHGPIDILFYAVGDLKLYQICESILLSSPVVISYFLLQNNFPYYSVFVSVLVLEIINLFAIIFIAGKKCDYPAFKYIKIVILPCLVISTIYILVFLYLEKLESNQIVIKGCLAIIVIVSSALFMFYCGFNIEEKNATSQLLTKVMRKFSLL